MVDRFHIYIGTRKGFSRNDERNENKSGDDSENPSCMWFKTRYPEELEDEGSKFRVVLHTEIMAWPEEFEFLVQVHVDTEWQGEVVERQHENVIIDIYHHFLVKWPKMNMVLLNMRTLKSKRTWEQKHKALIEHYWNGDESLYLMMQCWTLKESISIPLCSSSSNHLCIICSYGDDSD